MGHHDLSGSSSLLFRVLYKAPPPTQVAVVDALNFARAVADAKLRKLVNEQVAVASRVVVSKPDLVARRAFPV